MNFFGKVFVNIWIESFHLQFRDVRAVFSAKIDFTSSSVRKRSGEEIEADVKRAIAERKSAWKRKRK